MAELDEMADAMGISKNALKNAKADLKKDDQIKYRNTGQGTGKKFYVSLIDRLSSIAT